MNIYIIQIQLIIIFSSMALALSLCLNPLDPPYKRYGYAFITPLALSFLPHLVPKLNSHLDILIMFILLFFPIVLLLMRTFIFSVKTDRQMFYVPISISVILVLLILFKTDMMIASMKSTIVLTILFALNFIILYLLKNKHTHSLFKSATLLTISSLLLVIFKLINAPSIVEIISYIASIVGYYTAIKAIVDNHTMQNEKIIAKQKRLQEDFRDEVDKEVRRQTRRVEWAKEQIKQKSEIDNLTGALMKKPLIDLINSYIDSSSMQKFSILMFDIDNFKHLNDNFGHITGDKCLKDLVSIARSSIDFNDAIGRYGGDEFFIVLPNQPAGSALKVANRFRENVMKKTDPQYTISIGVASYPWDGKTHRKLIEVADAGLYKSKEKGRNSASYTGVLRVDI